MKKIINLFLAFILCLTCVCVAHVAQVGQAEAYNTASASSVLIKSEDWTEYESLWNGNLACKDNPTFSFDNQYWTEFISADMSNIYNWDNEDIIKVTNISFKYKYGSDWYEENNKNKYHKIYPNIDVPDGVDDNGSFKSYVVFGGTFFIKIYRLGFKFLAFTGGDYASEIVVNDISVKVGHIQTIIEDVNIVWLTTLDINLDSDATAIYKNNNMAIEKDDGIYVIYSDEKPTNDMIIEYSVTSGEIDGGVVVQFNYKVTFIVDDDVYQFFDVPEGATLGGVYA